MNSVAIVGAHQDTRHLAPYNDPKIDIWVQNEAAQMSWCPRVDAVFQLHLPTVYKNPQNRAGVDHWSWLKLKHNLPIYMQDIDPEVPDSVPFPFAAVESLPFCEKRMFSSTVAYMLAYACLIQVPKIQMWGIEAGYYSEYMRQREGIAYWVGYCQGHGIEVERHSGDGLFVQPLYGREGIWYQDPKHYEERMSELNRLVKLAARKVDSLIPGSPGWMDAIVEQSIAEGRRIECQRYLEKIHAMVNQTGEAILDKTELERASKDYLPLIDGRRMTAQQALGRNDLHNWRKLQTEAAQLAGRWQENQDMIKAAP